MFSGITSTEWNGVKHDESGLNHVSSLQARKVRLAEERSRLILSAALCGVFMVVEVVGGYLAGSLAVMADAAHLLSDLVGFLVSLIAISVSDIPGDGLMTYGYARAEVIGALVSIFLVWALTAVLVFMALMRIFHPQDVNGPLMFLIATFGLIVNVVMGLVLGHNHNHGSGGHGHGHDHHVGHGHAHDCEDSAVHPGDTHDHDHVVQLTHGPGHDHHHGGYNCENEVLGDSLRGAGYSSIEPMGFRDASCRAQNRSAGNSGWTFGGLIKKLIGDDIRSVNIRAAYLHVLGDILQNVGVMLASLVIWWNAELRIADPICTLFFSIIVVYTSRGLVSEAVVVLMEGVPRGIVVSDVWNSLMKIGGVVEVEDLHIWSLTTDKPTLSAQLITSSDDFHSILKDAQKMLQERFGMMHTTIQLNCAEGLCCGKENSSGRQEHCVSSGAAQSK
eukprot:CAMPEP_0184683112 /NCGR_PEP_ID=MMETSP0312-20130426/9977_1 /TAXON_ID=31354 /ORGANISM="Compsopogon coeruleus, Strain SAG 36.94" /LENGTH=445 /DNA_ID=CAMNT_0027135201 /DNA_START=42 /DNA_END=1379 /DNA_ORIENTATION=+